MKKGILILMALGLLFSSCRKDDVPHSEKNETQRTLLMYVVADNNIAGYLYRGVSYLMEGLDAEILLNNRVIVYADGPGASAWSDKPELLELVVDEDGNIVKKVIEEFEERNSADADVLAEIVARVIRDYPAKDYGLILSSHATGWLPVSPFSRSFGDDRGNQMLIPDLANAIPDNTFKYIISDACYMACTELVYELRNKTDYILASPTETFVEGFPYQKIAGDLFTENLDWKKLCDTYYQHYASKPDTVSRSAAMSVIKMDELDGLAAIGREIFKGGWDEFKNYPGLLIDAQYFDRFDRMASGGYHVFFDAGELVERFSPPYYDPFMAQMARVVPYYRHTKQMFYGDGYGTFPINRYSGLSAYIPRTASGELDDYYKTLGWYKAVFE